MRSSLTPSALKSRIAISTQGVPLLFAVLSYWLIGFACACWLGFRTPSGAVGVWIGLSIGTAVYAVLLLLRFRGLTSKLSFR